MSKYRTFARGLAGLVVFGVVAVGGTAAALYATAGGAMSFPNTPYPDLSATTDPAVIERGRYLALGPAHCNQCHSVDDRTDFAGVATSPLDGGFSFPMGPIATSWAPNLTPHPTTGIGRYTDAELARTLRYGIRPNHSGSIFMKLSAADLSEEDIVAVLSFLRAQPPVDHDVPESEVHALGRMMWPLFPWAARQSPPPRGVQAGSEPTLERGAYLASHVALCAACHSRYDPSTFEPVGPVAGGGLPEPSHGDDVDKEFVAPNLTSDPTGVTGQLDEDAFVARMRQGRRYPSSIMPWESFQNITDGDLRSIYRYLRSLPPVSNDVGPSYRDAGWTPP